MKNKLWSIGKIAITIAILTFLLMQVNLAAMAQHLARANPMPLLVALALYLLAIALGTVKWQVLVRAQNMNSTFADLMGYSLIGLFFGNLLPSNVGGDIVRAWGLVRASGRAEVAAISVLVDRLMGLVAFLGAAVVMSALAAVTLTRGGELEQIGIAAVAAAALFFLACAVMFSGRTTQRVKRVLDLAPSTRIQPIARRVYHALQGYRHSHRALALNLALSASIVVVTTLVWYAIALALGVTASLGYFFLFNPLIALVLLLPISFNGLGPKEATAVFFFGLIGVPSDIALSMSLIFHLLIVLTSLPGGVIWWRERELAPSR